MNLLLPLILTVASECLPDTRCIENRKCEFGSEEAYDYVRNQLFTVAGCSHSCIGECDCSCNTSGVIYQDLIADSPLYCKGTDNLCDNAIYKRAINFATSSWPCEQVFAQAQRSLIQLCGKTNGICSSGQCSDPICTDQVAPTCEQTDGTSEIAQWIVSFILILGITLYGWGQEAIMEFLMTEEYKTNSKKDDDYTRDNDNDDDDNIKTGSIYKFL
jgi:hypothetical protein